MTVAICAIALAFTTLLAVIGILAIDNMHMAIKARDAQIQAARVLAIYEAVIGAKK